MVFFLAIDGTKSGALTRFQVLERIEAGEADRSTLAWSQGMEVWRPLEEIPEFEAAFDPPAPAETGAAPGLEAKANPVWARGAEKGESVPEELRPLPWMRLFARGIDLILFFVVFQFGFAFFFPGVVLEVANSFTAQVMTLSAMIVVWSVVEAILLSTWGFTLGKALFKVIVRDEAGEILTFKRALQRALLVWVKGLALMFVWITPIAMMIAHARLMIFGKTTWDRDLRIRVTHGRPNQISQFAVAIAIFAAFAFMVYKAVQLQMEETRDGNRIEGQGRPKGAEGNDKPEPPPANFPEDIA